MFNNLEKPSEQSETEPETKITYPNDERILASILEENETVNSQDSQGYTALHRATKQGNT